MRREKARLRRARERDGRGGGGPVVEEEETVRMEDGGN